jgi:DNA polymerase-3 subunit beta
VLANVLLRTEDAGLKLTATNLEIGITYWVPGKIETDGAITVPARLLTDVVNSLPNERIDLELQDGDRLHLRCGRFETHLRGIDADEFPAIPAAGERPTTRVSQKVLRRALAEVTFAAASDEARPILTGVLTRFEGDRITLAAADNYRIAITTIAGLDAVEETSIVVPARSYTELARVLSDTDDPVDLILSAQKNQVLFHADGVDLVSRLIDGQFPNYQQVLPATHATRVELDRDDLLKAVRLAAYIASASANIVKIQVAPDGAPQVTVGAAADVGDHQGVVDAVIEGDGTTIAFNARYLGDVLQNVDTDRFSIELNGPLSPGVFRPADGRDYTHVVMPVRTTSRRWPGPAGTTLLTSLRLAGFRAYDTLDVSFGPGPHLVWGANAAGKTSLLEAVVLLARGSSHRTGVDAEMIRWTAPFARVDGRRGADVAPADVDVTLVREGPSRGRKRIRVNGVPRRSGALAGILRTVVFAPEEMLRSGPEPRRRRSTPATQRFPTPPTSPATGADAAQPPAPGDPGGAGVARSAPLLGREAPRGRGGRA